MPLGIFRSALLAIVCMIPVISGANPRDVVRIGGDIVVEDGTTVRNAVTVAGDVSVQGMVEGDVVSIGGLIILTPSAIVQGNAVTLGGSVRKERGARVEGAVVETDVEYDIPWIVAPNDWHWGRGWNWQRIIWGLRIFALVGFLVLALVLVVMLPKPFAAVGEVIGQHTLWTVLWGCVGTALIGPVALLLVLSFVGIAVIPLAFVALTSAYCLGYIAVAQLTGRRLLLAVRGTGLPMILEVCLGLLALAAVGLIPALGWLLTGIALLTGFGGVLVLVFQRGGLITRP